MTPSGQSVCLCMIVRNEAHVVLRCLESVIAIIDHWVIVDTGSTDGTQDIIRSRFRGIPGELFERPWRDFAFNRTECLALGKTRADYSLVIDADDTLVFEPTFRLPRLDKDCYTIEIIDDAIRYQRIQMVRSALDWRYRGVLHEFVECDGAASRGILHGVRMRRQREGARAKDADTFRQDAALLERTLESERDPFLIARYMFYLAQSYRDAGEPAKAIDRYLRRSQLGYWDQERYVSLYTAANLMAETARPEVEVVRTYRDAIGICIHRAEAYHGLSRYYRSIERFEDGFRAAQPALGLRPRAGDLFTLDWIFEYGVLDEYSINAYWAGHDLDSLDACETILQSRAIPTGERERIETNAEFARSRLASLGRLPPRLAVNDLDLTDPNFIFDPSQTKISICQIGANTHSGIFTPLVEGLNAAFVDLGYDSKISVNALRPGHVNIVLGFVYDATLAALLDRPFVLYQLEQVRDAHGFLEKRPRHRSVMEKATIIWEFSPQGCRLLESTGLAPKVAYLPPSFHRSYESFRPKARPTTDVLMVGSNSVRRQQILDRLRAANIETLHLFGVYGHELTEQLRNAKIIINIHHSENRQLETVRLMPLLANRCFVISEVSDHNPYGDGLVYAAYDDLVETCALYLGEKAHERAAIAARGYVKIRESDLVTDLSRVLEQFNRRQRGLP